MKPYDKYQKDKDEKYRQQGQGFHQKGSQLEHVVQQRNLNFEVIMPRFSEESKKIHAHTKGVLRNQQESVLNIENLDG